MSRLPAFAAISLVASTLSCGDNWSMSPPTVLGRGTFTATGVGPSESGRLTFSIGGLGEPIFFFGPLLGSASVGQTFEYSAISGTGSWFTPQPRFEPVAFETVASRLSDRVLDGIFVSLCTPPPGTTCSSHLTSDAELFERDTPGLPGRPAILSLHVDSFAWVPDGLGGQNPSYTLTIVAIGRRMQS